MFIGPEDVQAEKEFLVKQQIMDQECAEKCFGNGYAVQRNIILYEALETKGGLSDLLDDDEYPLAVTDSMTSSLWSGQSVLEEHVRGLQFSDVTNGYHCGYLTPIPFIEFDGVLGETHFRMFTDALSSDVLKWESVQRMIRNGGVKYADKKILMEHKTKLVRQEKGAKFISGGNLGINLTCPEKVLPFYNPPGARGEDSILSTCLENHTVKKIPVYTLS